MRIITPEFPNCPTVFEHEDFLESEHEEIRLNLKFGTFELNYPTFVFDHPGDENECIECGGPIDEHNSKQHRAPELAMRDNGKIIFNKDFNQNWILYIFIKKDKKTNMFNINIKIYNADDGDVCEICENNRFHFELTSVVDSYTLYHYAPPKGEFMEHSIIPDKELNDELKEKMK